MDPFRLATSFNESIRLSELRRLAEDAQRLDMLNMGPGSAGYIQTPAGTIPFVTGDTGDSAVSAGTGGTPLQIGVVGEQPGAETYTGTTVTSALSWSSTSTTKNVNVTNNTTVTGFPPPTQAITNPSGITFPPGQTITLTLTNTGSYPVTILPGTNPTDPGRVTLPQTLTSVVWPPGTTLTLIYTPGGGYTIPSLPVTVPPGGVSQTGSNFTLNVSVTTNLYTIINQSTTPQVVVIYTVPVFVGVLTSTGGITTPSVTVTSTLQPPGSFTVTTILPGGFTVTSTTTTPTATATATTTVGPGTVTCTVTTTTGPGPSQTTTTTVSPQSVATPQVFSPILSLTNPNNANTIGLTSQAPNPGYILTLPNATPTANQVLSATSVSGSNVTTSWVNTPTSPVTVANGGTGDTSLTAYAVLCGGTTATAAVQSVSGVGTSGQVLTSNGPGALPTWQPASGGGGTPGGSSGQLQYNNAGAFAGATIGAGLSFSGGLLSSTASTVTADGVTILNTAGVFSVIGGCDMLSNFVNSANALTNPSGTTLTANTWNVITATVACTANMPTATAGHVIGIRIATSSTNLLTVSSIDGSARVMWAGESAICVADGSTWKKVAGKTIPMLCTMRLTATTTGGAVTYNTVYKVLINSADADNTGLMADTTNHQITIKRGGVYVASGVVIFTNQALGGLSADSPRCITQIQKGGAGIANSECPGKATGLPSPFVTLNVTLAAADIMTLIAYQNSAGSANQDAYGAALGTDAASQLSLLEIPQW